MAVAPTLIPTFETSAVGRSMPMVSHPPGRGLDDATIEGELPDLGLNMPFVADLLSAVLAHERGGRHLYRAIAGRTNNPVLRAKYEEFGDETEQHAAILEQLIAHMGGDAQYVSPAARATEAAGKRIIESTFVLAGSIDVTTAEMVMLDAVLLAESIDHANWAALDELCAALPDGELRDRFRSAVDEVLTDEDEHLGWARDMRTRMILMQSEHPTMATVAATSEELLERVRGWFA